MRIDNQKWVVIQFNADDAESHKKALKYAKKLVANGYAFVTGNISDDGSKLEGFDYGDLMGGYNECVQLCKNHKSIDKN